MSKAGGQTEFATLLGDVQACTLCTDLPLGPRPVVQVSAAARILVAGQAPGRKAHARRRPFDDASGDRLRDWMGIDRAVFYGDERIACLPMGFCYPGSGRGGDLPPRPECAATWRAPLLAGLSRLELVLVMGRYAIDWHFPEQAGLPIATVTRRWQSSLPGMLALPHPSPRNNRWLKLNPWFERDVVPRLRGRVAEIIG